MSRPLGKGPLGVKKTRMVVAVEGTVPKPCPGQAGLDGSAANTACCVFQDELSHINARLNMGILGCEYPRGPHSLGLSVEDAQGAVTGVQSSSTALLPSPGSLFCSL